MRSTYRYLVLLTAIVSFVLPPETAGQVRAMSLEELSNTSNTIVLAQTVDRRSYWTGDRSKIYTDVRIRIEDRLKGDVASEIVITVPGGRVGNTLYEVSDMPFFVDDEEVLLFLWDHPSGKTLVTGGMQGKLEIIEAPAAQGKMIRGVGLDEAATLAKTGILRPDSPPGVRPLEGVLSEIRKYVQP